MTQLRKQIEQMQELIEIQELLNEKIKVFQEKHNCEINIEFIDSSNLWEFEVLDS